MSENVKGQIFNFKSWSHMLEFTDSLNMTPLLTAVKNNHTEIVKLLVEEGANVYV
jgi:ankyrin repeat protein